MSLVTIDYDFVRKLVRESSGIVLEKGKEYLIDSRLQALVRQEGLPSFEVLIDRLKAQPLGELRKKVIDAMTTNETSFFRDKIPFDSLRETILPNIMERRAASRSITIWCGACSTGQEPVSIAMLVKEHLPRLASWSFRIIATDISHEVLNRARKGSFNQIEVNRGLPAPLLVKYFERKGMEWQVKPDVLKLIEYKEMNLLAPSYPLPEVDIVFLRNVLIYFDIPTKKAILGKVRKVLRPDGYLFLGNAETTMNLDTVFERMPINRTGCYRIKA